MQFRVRRLAPGEVDYELIWLSVSVSSVALAAAWLAIGLPWPVCIFHQLTGLPCVTCGMTRCAIQFFHGHFVTALKWNPLIFTLLCGVIAFDLYALATLTMRVPRFRIFFSTQQAKTFVRLSVILVFALNWTYLLSHWRDF
jgi:ribose/xylose/arabinose/galactoside ABC-type transport system permease subunit